MFRTPVDGFFPDFLRAQNMVRVIEGKIIRTGLHLSWSDSLGWWILLLGQWILSLTHLASEIYYGILITKELLSTLLIIGLVKMTFGLAHGNNSLLEWQAVKLTFFDTALIGWFSKLNTVDPQ